MLRMVFLIVIAVLSVVILGSAVWLLSLSRRTLALSDRTTVVFASLILWAAGVRLRIEGREHLAAAPASILIGNHQSALDIPLVMKACKGNVRFLAKESLFRVPVMGAVLRRQGHMAVRRENPRTTLLRLRAFLEKMRDGAVSVAVFPEGTRSVDGRLLPFRQGSMRICRFGGLPVVPFAVQGAMDVLRRGHWRVRPGVITLRFAAPIPHVEAAAMNTSALSDRLRSDIERMLQAGSP